MTGSDPARQAMLARIRAALGRVTELPPGPPPSDPALVRTCEGSEMCGEFRRRAESVGAAVHTCVEVELQATLRDVVAHLAVRSATLSIATAGLAALTRTVLLSAGATIIDHAAKPGLLAHFQADAGITDVGAAIAESGTIVLNSGFGRNRGSHMAPPIHIAIVREAQIVPDLIDLWPDVAASPVPERPTSQVLITGPSKTADIEGILITGVHGPRELHVILVTSTSA